MRLFRSILQLPSIFLKNNERILCPDGAPTTDETHPERVAELTDSHGWEAGIEKASAELSLAGARRLRRRLESYSNIGWIISMLDPRWRKAVLVADPGMGTLPVVLSRFFERVYLLVGDETVWNCQRKRIEWLAIKNIERLEGTLPLVLEDHSCDAAILYVSSFTILDDALLQETNRVLRAAGTCYVGFENRHNGHDLRAWPKCQPTTASRRPKNSRRSIQTKLRQHFQSVRFYSVREELDDVREIRSPRADALWEIPSRSLKASLKSRLQYHLASAYGVVSSNNSSHDPLIHLILKETAARLDSGRSITLRRLLMVKPNGLLLIAGEAGRHEELIIRVPLDELTLKRQRVNHEALVDLRSLKSLSGRTPQPLASGEVHGFAFFVESIVPGTTPERLSKGLARQITDVLARFHQETAHPAVVNEGHLRELVDIPFSHALPWIMEKDRLEFHQLHKKVTAALLGENIPFVRSHGDLSFHNVLIDEKTQDLTGMIDWDSSGSTAFPLIDLLYLLHHQQINEQKSTLAQAVGSRLILTDLTSFQRELFTSYCDSLGLAEKFLEVFSILSWLYHLAYRLQYTERYKFPFVIRWCSNSNVVPKMNQTLNSGSQFQI